MKICNFQSFSDITLTHFVHLMLTIIKHKHAVCSAYDWTFRKDTLLSQYTSHNSGVEVSGCMYQTVKTSCYSVNWSYSLLTFSFSATNFESFNPGMLVFIIFRGDEIRPSSRMGNLKCVFRVLFWGAYLLLVYLWSMSTDIDNIN